MINSIIIAQRDQAIHLITVFLAPAMNEVGEVNGTSLQRQVVFHFMGGTLEIGTMGVMERPTDLR